LPSLLKVFISTIPLCLLHFCCGNTRSFDKSIRLTARVIASDSLRFPTILATVSSSLLVGDGKLHAVQVYRRSDGALTKTIGKSGRGPGEILVPWSFATTPEDTERFWLFDAELLRFTQFRLGDGHYVKSVNFGFPSPYYPVWISDSLIVSPTLKAVEHRLAYYRANGEFVTTMGEFPSEMKERTPLSIRSQSLQSKLRIKPDRTLVMLCARYANRIDIYSSDGNLRKSVVGPQGFFPVYEPTSTDGKSVLVMDNQNTRFGYIDAAVTDRFMFTLYSGRSRKDFPGKANFGEDIHVFDWAGNLLQVFKLDNDVLAITVDQKAEILYAIRHYPTVALLAYDLPNI